MGDLREGLCGRPKPFHGFEGPPHDLPLVPHHLHPLRWNLYPGLVNVYADVLDCSQAYELHGFFLLKFFSFQISGSSKEVWLITGWQSVADYRLASFPFA